MQTTPLHSIKSKRPLTPRERSEVNKFRMVRLHMSLPTDALVELLIAHRALETLPLLVDPHVLHQILLPAKRLGADRTGKRPLLRVHHPMVQQAPLVVELLLAEGARVVVRRVSDDEVGTVHAPFVEGLPALGAVVGLRRLRVDLDEVVDLRAPIGEPLPAQAAAQRPTGPARQHVLAPRFAAGEWLLAAYAYLELAVAVGDVAGEVLTVHVRLAAGLARELVVVAAGVAAEGAQAGQLDVANRTHPPLGAQLEHLHADFDVQVDVEAVGGHQMLGDRIRGVKTPEAHPTRKLHAIDLEVLRVVVKHVGERGVRVEIAMLRGLVPPILAGIVIAFAAVDAYH